MSAARRNPVSATTAPRRLLADFLPPEGVPINFEVSGLGARTAAQATDILLTGIALIAFMMVLLLSEVLPPSGVLTVGALLFFAIRAPYYTLTEILWNGQTPGKRLLGLRVISGDGRALSPHAVTVRNLMKEMEVFAPGSMLLAVENLQPMTVLMLLGWITILLIVPLTNKHRQRLGDIMANTYVVNVPRPLLLPDLAEEKAAAPTAYSFLPHHLDHYGRFELQTLESLLQVKPQTLNRSALARHRENLELVTRTIVKRIGFEEEVPPGRAREFLMEFYRTQRSYLENRKLFGDAREDKFHREDTDTGNRT